MNRSRVSGVAAALALLLAGAVLAQNRPAPRYDVSAEKTLSGKVEAVTEIPGGRRGGGLHLTLTVSNDKWDVHLGPSSFVKEIGLELAQGDSVDVTGSAHSAKKILIARIVRKGEKSFTLRDAQGFPLWARGRARSK